MAQLVEVLAYVHHKQLLTYLRLLHLPVGLLINFGAPTLKQGLRRIVNDLNPQESPALTVNRSPVIKTFLAENSAKPEDPENPD